MSDPIDFDTDTFDEPLEEPSPDYFLELDSLDDFDIWGDDDESEQDSV